MATVFLYIIICYLVAIGLLIEQRAQDKESVKFTSDTFFQFILTPILLPIVLGMMLQEKDKENSDAKKKK